MLVAVPGRTTRTAWFIGGSTALFCVACQSGPIPTLLPRDGSGGSGGGSVAEPVCDADTPEPCAAVQRLLAGESYGCVVTDDGRLRCHGDNTSGQLGDPEVSPAVFGSHATPPGLSSESDFALARTHGCAIDVGDDHRVKCWGRNTLGQLGTDDYIFHNQPTAIGIRATAIDNYHDATCAVSEGEVHCWGLSLNGQTLPNADEGDHELSPVRVPDLKGAVDVAVGRTHACALLDDDSVWCWGQGGLLGDGTTDGGSEPVRVDLNVDGPIRYLASGASHTCVIVGEPGTIHCWGAYTESHDTTTPVELGTFAGPIVSFDTGFMYGCALLADGHVQCFGESTHGQLGLGTALSLTPANVVDVSDAVGLVVGPLHACALRSGGQVVCWGSNMVGNWGMSSPTSSGLPVEVTWE